MKMPEMNYDIKQADSIEVSLPLTSQGKFRCKKRSCCQDFGDGFPPSTEEITPDAYLEWQIGYDTIIGKDEKETKLNTDVFVFRGANNKLKHPYELSEILYYMCKKGIITKAELENIQKKISLITDFLQDKYTIDVKKEAPVCLNGIDFLSSSTKLPTFIMQDKTSKLMIEIMIQKQQYATGTQPMLYLIVPVDAFDNANDIIGYTAKKTPRGIVSFSESNKNIIFDLLICFGMCSASHKHDIQEIIKVIIKNAF
jgi:hypothetical protein